MHMASWKTIVMLYLETLITLGLAIYFGVALSEPMFFSSLRPFTIGAFGLNALVCMLGFTTSLFFTFQKLTA